MKVRAYSLRTEGETFDGVEFWIGRRMLCRMHPSGIFAIAAAVLLVASAMF